MLDVGGSGKRTEKSTYTFYVAECKKNERALVTQTFPRTYDIVKSRSRNVVPLIVGRFGCYVEPVDSLICLRAGCAFLGTKFKTKRLIETIERDAVPTIGIDCEKSFLCSTKSSWNVRISADYSLGFSKNKRNSRIESMDNNGKTDICKVFCRSNVRYYAFRVTCIYNFGLF